MNFEINGVSYFLGFNEENGQWQLLTPTRRGLRRMNVVNDEAQPFMGMQVWEEEDVETPRKVN